MIFEYAIDPSALKRVEDFRTLLEAFGAERGRLISDTPRQWLREAFCSAAAIECGDVKRKALKVRLQRLASEALVKRPLTELPYARAAGWLNYALQQHSNWPYSGILTNGEAASPDLFPIDELVFHEPDSWSVPRDIHVLRSAPAMVDALDPLLRISSSASLIDPHFYPRSPRFMRVFAEILGRCARYNFGRGLSSIYVHTNAIKKDMQQAFDSNVRHLVPEGVRVVVSQWQDDILHDRFVLTNVGGLKFGQGLDEWRPGGPKEVNVSVVGNEVRRGQLAKFASPNQPLLTFAI